MPIEPLIHTPRTVRPTAEADRRKPDGQPRGDGRRKSAEPAHAPPPAAPDDHDRSSGTFIDVTA